MMKIYFFLILGIIMFVSSSGVVLAEEKSTANNASSAPALTAPGNFSQATLEVLKNKNWVEPLPMEEGTEYGYWWIKQDYATKLDCIKRLKESFKIYNINTTMSEEYLVKKFDEFYQPLDNPLDIKMDKSLERAFSLIMRGNVK